MKLIKKILTILITIAVLSMSCIAVSANPFTDVSTDEWYYDEVLQANDMGIMIGTSEDKFEPDTVVTREMFVTALARSSFTRTEALSSSNNDYSGSFEDDWISGFWYSRPIAWAQKAGIVTGIDEKTFGLGQPVTREQIATFVYRYVNRYLITLPDIDTPVSEFKDKPSAYAADAVEFMRKTGIVNGVGNNKFDPKAHATRAEVAAILLRFEKALENAKYGTKINVDNVSEIMLRDVSRLENGWPHEVVIKDKQTIEYLVKTFNDAEVIGAEYLAVTGYTYLIRCYDETDNLIFDATLSPSQYYVNEVFYNTTDGALQPIIDFIKSN